MTITRVYATDPIHGDDVSLAELAQRHDFDVSCLRRRYNQGKRGHELIKPTNSVKRATPKPKSGLKAAKPLTDAEREAAIDQVRSGRYAALSAPLVKRDGD